MFLLSVIDFTYNRVGPLMLQSINSMRKSHAQKLIRNYSQVLNKALMLRIFGNIIISITGTLELDNIRMRHTTLEGQQIFVNTPA